MDTDTDLSSDDEPLSQTQTARRTRPKHKGSYKISNALKPPRTTSYTAKALYDQISQGSVELNPEYQRGVVWNAIKMSNLIDSIYRNFYIPPIIFAVKTRPDGTDEKICIDGKQRLSSIQAFFDGLIPTRDVISDKKFWFKDSHQRKASDELLEQRFVHIFENKQIVCVEYQDLSEEDEREIFRRVQEGTALTTAEKMKSSQGPWALLSRDILETHIEANEEEMQRLGIKWDRSRARDFFNVGSVLYALHKHPTLTVVPSGATIQKFLQGVAVKHGSVEGPTDHFRKMMMETFEIFFIICKDKKLSKCIMTQYTYKGQGADEEGDSPKKIKANKGKIAPIEFVMINVLIFIYKSRYSLKELADGIAHLRKSVREKFIDIRANTRTAKFCTEVVQELENEGILVLGSKRGATAEMIVRGPDTKDNKSNVMQKRKRSSNGKDEDSLDDEEEEEEVEKEVIKKAKNARQTKFSSGGGDALPPAPPTSSSSAAGADVQMRNGGNGAGGYGRARSSSSSTLVNPQSSTPIPGAVHVKQQPSSPPSSYGQGSQSYPPAPPMSSSSSTSMQPPPSSGTSYPQSSQPYANTPPTPSSSADYASSSKPPVPRSTRPPPGPSHSSYTSQHPQQLPPNPNLPPRPPLSSNVPLQPGLRATSMSVPQTPSHPPPAGPSGAYRTSGPTPGAPPPSGQNEKFNNLRAIKAEVSSNLQDFSRNRAPVMNHRDPRLNRAPADSNSRPNSRPHTPLTYPPPYQHPNEQPPRDNPFGTPTLLQASQSYPQHPNSQYSNQGMPASTSAPVHGYSSGYSQSQAAYPSDQQHQQHYQQNGNASGWGR